MVKASRINVLKVPGYTESSIRKSELERYRWCSENEIIEKCTGRDLGGGHRTVLEIG